MPKNFSAIWFIQKEFYYKKRDRERGRGRRTGFKLRLFQRGKFLFVGFMLNFLIMQMSKNLKSATSISEEGKCVLNKIETLR